MKQLLKIIAGVVVIVSLVVFVLTFRQANQEEDSMLNDLQYRTTLLADSFKESIRPSYLNNATSALQAVLDKFSNRERLLGLAVYGNQGDVFAVSAGLPSDLTLDPSIPERAMDSDSVEEDFLTTKNSGKVYILATPLHQEGKVMGALVVFQRANYIGDAINQIWRTNLLSLLIQAILFSIAIVLILRWIIFRPVLRLIEVIHQARAGHDIYDSNAVKSHGFFHPIAVEISKMSKNLIQARAAASEEARLRLDKVDSPWTEERLKEFMKGHLKERKIFVVSNREPYVHSKIKNEIQYAVPASGMITALDPIMRACGGLWIAHGSGNADKLVVDKNAKLMVPPDEPKYTLKRIWLAG
ncbi:MAG: Alpha,alpha-trehalose-phosphate synthase (UDP-forming) [Candidatus Peregrinibacteria bacterium GW2011_GWA2_47_7]|nr:MAG: Alpha,alpha-trehalose-phosphate synthase (UDP-forming) [Candidatus Peregrinibacteria bacterium GW2011_GWA2_47_7]